MRVVFCGVLQEACQLSDAEKRDVERRIRDARRLASMAKACDHYRLLGLERTCTAEEVGGDLSLLSIVPRMQRFC